jgi:hypothetical protein
VAGARWPTYRDTFVEPYFDGGSVPPLDQSWGVVLFHLGYAVCALIGIYATAAAFSGGRVPLSRLWGYVAVLALYVLEELVFFQSR